MQQTGRRFKAAKGAAAMTASKDSLAPKRIQRKRAKGWKMPPNTVYVGRPTRWGNPFSAGKDGCPDIDAAIEAFKTWLCEHRGTIPALKSELRGKNLACWCPLNKPCHADVLLEIANAYAPRGAGKYSGPERPAMGLEAYLERVAREGVEASDGVTEEAYPYLFDKEYPALLGVLRKRLLPLLEAGVRMDKEISAHPSACQSCNGARKAWRAALKAESPAARGEEK